MAAAAETSFLSPADVDIKFAEIRAQQAKEEDADKSDKKKEEDKKKKEEDEQQKKEKEMKEYMEKSPQGRHPLHWRNPTFRKLMREQIKEYERDFGPFQESYSILLPTRFEYEESLHAQVAEKLKKNEMF
jgi:hypothetical protein